MNAGASDTEVAAMRRALELAARGPAIGPNPQVGCVLLDPAGNMVAEGWHRGVGTAHAEVDALTNLAASGKETTGLTAVVTLEPCNHTGHTGPCSVALADAGIARVVYSVSDPTPRADGGAEYLRSRGVDVVSDVLADEVSQFMHRWLTAASKGRPYITVKWAASLDGRVAAADGTSRWITGTAARQRVHEERAANGAIVVGTGTVLADDPSLTARGDAGELLPQQPVPVVIGERPIPADAKLRSHPAGLIETGSRDLELVFADLYQRGICSAYVEGGPTLATAIIAAGLADELSIFLGPVLLGGDRLAIGDLGIPTLADAARFRITKVELLGDDVLITAVPKPDHRDS